MKSSILVVCALIFKVNTGKGESEENSKFQPKSAREAMRYASRIAAKQNTKELASTERCVLIERVENGQLIKERFTLAEKEDFTNFGEDFKATKKPTDDGFSKFEDDGNWYRTPQERQEAFKLARMKKVKSMRKLRAKMLHEGSDEMQVGSAQKDDNWRKSLKEMKGKERLLWKRNRLKKRRPRRSAEDYNENKSLYKKDFDMQNFKKNFLADGKEADPEKEVTRNFEWAKRMGITISTVRVFLDEQHDNVKYIVLKPPPKNWPQPRFNYFQNKNAKFPRGMYTRFTRPTRYYATIPPHHPHRISGSKDQRRHIRPPEVYIQKSFEKMTYPTLTKRGQGKSSKVTGLSSSEEKSLEETIKRPSEEQVTEVPKTGSMRRQTANTSIYTYDARNYESYNQRPTYRHFSFVYSYTYETKQPRKVITPVHKKLILRSEFRNELIRTTAEAKEKLTTTLVTWPTIHRKKGYEFARRSKYGTPWQNGVINPELKEKSMTSWMSRREDWGRRDAWRIDPAHEVPFPPSVTNTSGGDPGVLRQDDYRQKQPWNEANYFTDEQQRPYRRQHRPYERFPPSLTNTSGGDPGVWRQTQPWNEANYFTDDQQRPYRRQHRPYERFSNRDGRGRGQPYRGRSYRGKSHYRGDRYATTYNEAAGQSSNSSMTRGMEYAVRPAAVPRNVRLGIEMAREWNKLAIDSGQNIIVTPVKNLDENVPDLRQPRTPFSNFRLLESTRTSWKVYASQTTITCDTTQQFSRHVPSQADDDSSMLQPRYRMMTTSRLRPRPPDDGPSMLRPSYMKATSRPRPTDGTSMLQPSYKMTTSRTASPPDDGSSNLRPNYMITTVISKADYGSSMLRPSYMVMTTRIPRSSVTSSMFRPNYMMTTRIPGSSGGSSMLRPSYMEMTDVPPPPEFTSMYRSKYAMRSVRQRSPVGSSMLRPDYMTMTAQPRPPQFTSIHRPTYRMDDAEAGENKKGVMQDDMEARKGEEKADETEQLQDRYVTTYRKRFVRTKRQRIGRRKYKYLRRQQYRGRKEKSIEVFRFDNETVEEEITENFEKLRMEYLGIGRRAPLNIPKRITVAPKEPAYQRGYNQKRKQLLEDKSLSDVESIQEVDKIHGQRLKTKQEPIVLAEPYMPACLLSGSEEQPKINKEYRYRTQVTVPPVEPRTTTKATGGKKAKKKQGKKTKNKQTFKFTKPVGDIKWEAYNRYDVPYTFRYTIAPTAIG